jgi:hypothetical protein
LTTSSTAAPGRPTRVLDPGSWAAILKLSFCKTVVGQLREVLPTNNVIERCFVEVRRGSWPMVCFVKTASVDRIIFSIFQRFSLEWKIRTVNLFTQAA